MAILGLHPADENTPLPGKGTFGASRIPGPIGMHRYPNMAEMDAIQFTPDGNRDVFHTTPPLQHRHLIEEFHNEAQHTVDPEATQ